MRHSKSHLTCLDWRWQRVLQLAGGECLPTLTDDPLVEMARRTLVDRSGSPPSEDPIPTAVTLAHAPEHFRLRAMVEARLLARQSLQMISERTGISRQAVGWFVTLFFDVIDCLSHPDAVYHFAIASGDNEQASHDLWARMLKLVGYCCGAEVLDRLTLETCATGELTLSQLQAALGEQSAAVAAQGLWELAQGTAVADSTSQRQLLRTLMREQASMSDADDSSNEITQNIEAMMQSIRLSIGEYTKETAHATATMLPNGAELTTDELMRSSLGLPVGGLEQAAQAQYPEVADHVESDIPGGQS